MLMSFFFFLPYFFIYFLFVIFFFTMSSLNFLFIYSYKKWKKREFESKFLPIHIDVSSGEIKI